MKDTGIHKMLGTALGTKELTDHHCNVPYILSEACTIEMISYSQAEAIGFKKQCHYRYPLAISYLPTDISRVIKKQYLECGYPLSTGDIMIIKFLGKECTCMKRHQIQYFSQSLLQLISYEDLQKENNKLFKQIFSQKYWVEKILNIFLAKTNAMSQICIE